MNTKHKQKLLALIVLVLCQSLALTSCDAGMSVPTNTPIPPTPTEIPPTPTPRLITAQESFELLTEWDFVPMLTTNAYVQWDGSGRIFMGSGEMQINFILRNPPLLHLDLQGSSEDLIFNHLMPRGVSPAKVVFVTPEVAGAQAAIPFFKTVVSEETATVKADGTDILITYFRVNEFIDYEGMYDFIFGIGAPNYAFGFSASDTNIFYDGSEHHIYGRVVLFGVKFTNNGTEPLIFRISGDRYEYISGSGTATIADGTVISYGN